MFGMVILALSLALAFADGDGSSEGYSNSTVTVTIDDGSSTIPSCFDFTDGVKSMTIQQCEESCISEGFTGGSKQGWGYPPVEACRCVGCDNYLCQDVFEVPTCSSIGVTSLDECANYCADDNEGEIAEFGFAMSSYTEYSGCECGNTYELKCMDDVWGVGDVVDESKVDGIYGDDAEGTAIESNKSFVSHITYTNVVVWVTVAQAFLWKLVDI